MATPTIKIDGATSGAGSAGTSRSDMTLGEVVTLSDPANASGTYLWELLAVPVGSAASLSSSSASSPTFIADVAGSYLIQCTHDSVSTAREVAAVLTANADLRIPAPGEETEFGATGWHAALDGVIRQVDTSAGGILKVTTADTTPATLNSKITVTSGHLVKSTVDPGGNETLNLAIGSNIPKLDTVATFTAGLGSALVTLSDAATIATDAALGNVFEVTLADNRTLGAPTNLVAGHRYTWIIRQDATGNRTLAFNAVFMFAGGTDPTLTTTANSVDVIEAVSDGTNLYCTSVLNLQ